MAKTATWYAARAAAPAPHPPLAGAVRADVCVVGGGCTGLSAALHLAEAGKRVVLLEAARIGDGPSGRNGGQVHTGLRHDQRALEARLGRDDARRLWTLALAGKALLHGLVARHAIACDLTPGLIRADHRARLVADTHAAVAHLRAAYGYDRVEPLDRDGLRALVRSDAYHGGAIDHGGGHLDPLAFVRGLARAAAAAGAVLHEDTRALHLAGTGTGHRVETADGAVEAAAVILAADGGGAALAPALGRHLAAITSLQVATAPLGHVLAGALTGPAAVYDSRIAVSYFRPTADGRLLFGGAERLGRPRGDLAAQVRPRLEAVFPQLRNVPISFAWGGPVWLTVPRLPHVRRLGPTLFAAGGWSGQGVVLAPLAGRVLAEAVGGTLDRFDLLAGLPARAFPGGPLRPALLALALLWAAVRDRL